MYTSDCIIVMKQLSEILTIGPMTKTKRVLPEVGE